MTLACNCPECSRRLAREAAVDAATPKLPSYVATGAPSDTSPQWPTAAPGDVVAFDHSALRAKHFEPGCGYCVCAHCARLPYYADVPLDQPAWTGYADVVGCNCALTGTTIDGRPAPLCPVHSVLTTDESKALNAFIDYVVSRKLCARRFQPGRWCTRDDAHDGECDGPPAREHRGPIERVVLQREVKR